MKDFKGTPGPWKYTIRNVSEMMTTFHGVVVGGTYIEAATRNEREDAQLISAAPELLGALQETIHEVGPWLSTQKPELKEKIESAINKALGE